VDDRVASTLPGLIQISQGPRQERCRPLAIPREGDDPGTEGQRPRRVLGAAPKLDMPYAFSNTLCNADRVFMARVEQENGECVGELPYKIRGADELGYLRRESRLDSALEHGFTFMDIGPEDAEGEVVPVPDSAPGLSEEEVKEGFVPEHARGRIMKGHAQPSFLPVPNSLPLPGFHAVGVRRTSRDQPGHARLRPA
jgi:hypothetical protein